MLAVRGTTALLPKPPILVNICACPLQSSLRGCEFRRGTEDVFGINSPSWQDSPAKTSSVPFPSCADASNLLAQSAIWLAAMGTCRRTASPAGGPCPPSPQPRPPVEHPWNKCPTVAPARAHRRPPVRGCSRQCHAPMRISGRFVPARTPPIAMGAAFGGDENLVNDALGDPRSRRRSRSQSAFPAAGHRSGRRRPRKPRGGQPDGPTTPPASCPG